MTWEASASAHGVAGVIHTSSTVPVTTAIHEYRDTAIRGWQQTHRGCAISLVYGEDGMLYRSDGAKRVADNALVAITLMIAESAPDRREILTHIVVELINVRN